MKQIVSEAQTRGMVSMLGPAGISQIGLVVKNLDAALESYWQVCRIGPWNIYTTGAPPLQCVYHGRPASYQIRLATASSGPVQVELIEYVSGDTIHRDFLDSGRIGVEHVGIFVPDLEKALQPYEKIGIGILQLSDGLGMKRDGRYAYLDTEAMFGTILELIQSSSQPMPPERIYPPTNRTHKGDIK